MMSFALYGPVALVVCLVLAALKDDCPREILRSAVKNFLLLTAVLAAGCLVVFALGRYL